MQPENARRRPDDGARSPLARSRLAFYRGACESASAMPRPDRPGFVNPGTGLSADYLNRIVGFSMLLDLAGEHAEVHEDLAGWSRVGYREHYERSDLPQAAEAIAAWDALPAPRRAAFGALVDAADDLVRATLACLAHARPRDLDRVVRMGGAALAIIIGEMRRAIEGGGTYPGRARLIADHGVTRLAALAREAA